MLMRSLTLGFWLFRRCVTHPAAWFALVVVAAVPPLIERLAPLGTISTPQAATLEHGYLATLWMAALVLGIGCLRHPFCSLLPARLVLVGQTFALGMTALATQILALHGSAPPFGLLLATVHLTLLALLAVRLPVPAPAQASLFIVGAWALPAMVTGPISRIRTLIDPSQHLGPESNFLIFGCAAAALVLFISSVPLRTQT